VTEFRRPHVEFRPAATPGAGFLDPNSEPTDVLLRTHASAQTTLIIKAKQLLARLDDHGPDLTVGLEPKQISATLCDHEAAVVIRVPAKEVGATWKLREDQGTDRAIFVIAKDRPQFGHHSVKLTN
jgi:hypothetical protein